MQFESSLAQSASTLLKSKLWLKPRWWKLLNPKLLTCSAASGSRWVSSRGTVNWIFLGLPVSMVALSVKKGNGTKRRRRRRRRREWSTQRQSKRRIRSSGRESEMKNKWAPGLKWDHCLLVLSGLCFSTFFGLRSSSIDSTPLFFFLSLLSAPARVSTISPLSFLSLTPSFHRGKGILGKEHLSFAPIRWPPRLLPPVPPSRHISFCLYWMMRIVLQQPLRKWERIKTPPLSLALSLLPFPPSLCLSLAFSSMSV